MRNSPTITSSSENGTATTEYPAFAAQRVVKVSLIKVFILFYLFGAASTVSFLVLSYLSCLAASNIRIFSSSFHPILFYSILWQQQQQPTKSFPFSLLFLTALWRGKYYRGGISTDLAFFFLFLFYISLLALVGSCLFVSFYERGREREVTIVYFCSILFCSIPAWPGGLPRLHLDSFFFFLIFLLLLWSCNLFFFYFSESQMNWGFEKKIYWFIPFFT